MVEFADVSLNTEISVIRLLADQATKHGKTHQVILMIELGDLREGILPSDLELVVEETLGMQGIKLAGIGTEPGLFQRSQAKRCKYAGVV